jgi:hypothetical protein
VLGAHRQLLHHGARRVEEALLGRRHRSGGTRSRAMRHARRSLRHSQASHARVCAPRAARRLGDDRVRWKERRAACVCLLRRRIESTPLPLTRARRARRAQLSLV